MNHFDYPEDEFPETPVERPQPTTTDIPINIG